MRGMTFTEDHEEYEMKETLYPSIEFFVPSQTLKHTTCIFSTRGGD